MLKKFVADADELMAILVHTRAIYDDYLRNLDPYKLKSLSLQKTLTGCLTEVSVCE